MGAGSLPAFYGSGGTASPLFYSTANISNSGIENPPAASLIQPQISQPLYGSTLAQSNTGILGKYVL